MRKVFLVLVIIVLTSPGVVQSAQRPSIEDRLIGIEKDVAILKEGQKALNQRIDDMNQRIDDLIHSIDKRFEGMDKRFGDLQFWLQFIFGVQVLILGGLIAQWLLMWKRIIGTEKILQIHLAEKEEKELISLQREEISLLKDRLGRLEGASV